jgi:hypothetical protein
MFGTLFSSLTSKIMLGVIVFAMAGFGFQSYRVMALKADVATLKGDNDVLTQKLQIAINVNQSQVAIVDDATKKLEQCVGQAELVTSTAARVSQDLQTRLANKTAELNRLRATKEKINATDPTCNAWSHAAVCGGGTLWLRDRWSTATVAHTDAAGGRSAQAVRGDPAKPDPTPGAGTAPAAGSGVPEAAGLVDCYSNAQYQDALDAALSAYEQAASQLDGIRQLSDAAVASNRAH